MAMERYREYLDFEVQVAANTRGDLEVQILDSPRDRPRCRFQPPCSPEEALKLIEGLDEVLDRASASKVGVARAGDEIPAAADLRQTGGQLFSSLFPPALQATLDAALNRQRVENESLRLRLSFDPQAEDLAPYGALPWEMLYHPGKRQFLARRPDVAIVRYLDVPVDIQRLFVQLPLRVLLIAPEPQDGETADVALEQRLVYQTLEKTPGIEVECAEPPTFEELLDRLSRQEVHVLHFMGHGGIDRKSREAGLFFENEARKGHRVYGRELAEKLAPFYSSLKLIVLNTCYGAAVRHRGDQDPFAGVTTALIAGGMTAVVGMQFLISTSGAVCFASSFYQKLAETGQVETAASHARRELHRIDSSSPEWITPVVYTRAASGRLFDPSEAPSAAEPVRIGIRSFFGWGVEIEDWSHAFLPLTSFFRGRYPLAGLRWHEDIYTRLTAFLDQAIVGRRAVHLDFAAHQSIAFTTGYLLEAKAGLEMTVRQRSAHKTSDWSSEEPALPGDWSWEVEEHELDAKRLDIALAVSPTRSVRSSVESYVEKKLAKVGRIVELRPPDGASQLAVQSGGHAFRLAEAISNRMHELTPGEWQGKFHLFYAGPNGLLFFLGRLCRGPRRIQLYEYDFDGQGNRTYMPSLQFPPGVRAQRSESEPERAG